MINIIVPILDKNKDKYNKLLSEIDGQEEINVYLGIEEKNLSYVSEFEESENVFIVTFENNSEMEGMINSLQKCAKEGSIILLRKPITLEELEKFISCEHEVATCKVERTKIKEYMHNFWQAMLKTFLGIKEYQGDTSAIYLDEDLSTVVRESGNLSYATRVNRWRGIDQTVINVKGEPVKNEIDKKNVTKFSLIAILSVLLAIIVTTVVCVTVKVGVVVGLLLVCLDLICVAVTFLTFVIMMFNMRTGNKIIAEANVKISVKK